MSHYPPYPPYPPPSPYLPPGDPFTYGDPADHLLAPARRAGLLMLVNAVLGLLLGACFVGVGVAFPQIQWPAEHAQDLQRMESELGLSIQVIFLIMGTVVFVPSLVQLILGLLVRRGGLGSAITGVVFTSLLLLLLVFQLIGSLVAGPGALGGICVLSLPLALLGLQLAWLTQAIRASASVRSARGAAYPLSPYPPHQQAPPPSSDWPMQPPPPPPL